MFTPPSVTKANVGALGPPRGDNRARKRIETKYWPSDDRLWANNVYKLCPPGYGMAPPLARMHLPCCLIDVTCLFTSQTIHKTYREPQTPPGHARVVQPAYSRFSLKRAVTLLTYEDDGGIHNSIFVTNTPWALWVQSIMDRFGLRAP